MSGWTDERVERLKALHAEGHSASEIARSLGEVTRNAVIGKVARLGLGPIGGGKASSPAQYRRTVAVKAPKPAKPPPPPKAAQRFNFAFPNAQGATPQHSLERKPPAPVRFVDEAPGEATLLTLGAHACKWPIGDPLEPSFTLCGRRREEGASYCQEHAAVAYRPKVTSAKELERSLRRYV
jgi:GcrA cell cycle regulator